MAGSRTTWVVVLGGMLAGYCSSLPGRASASCGDYVRMLGETSSHGASEATSERQPCDGPECSNRPLERPAPPPMTTVSLERQDALAVVDIPTKRISRRRHLEDRFGLPRFAPLSVFRPPRSFARN